VAMPTQRLKDFSDGGREAPLPDPEASDPLDLAIAREEVEELRLALLELPDEQRAVLVLTAAGFGHSEISARLGLSERAVRKRVERANRTLRERTDPSKGARD
jgi:RNA polymerase sigma factor (sigma-70 family)